MGNSARHGPHDTEPVQKACAGWKVAGRGNAPGGGFESADAAEMRGNADRAAAIAADSSRRTSRGDCRSFAAAGTTGGAREIPRVAGFSGEQIAALVGHQEFRGV